LPHPRIATKKYIGLGAIKDLEIIIGTIISIAACAVFYWARGLKGINNT
jgi:hypothetical protein